MAEWLSMGGYGIYVWLAYGVAAGILLGNVLGSCHRQRRAVLKVRRMLTKDLTK